MLLTKELEVIPSGRSISHYRKLGYEVKYLVPLTVKVEDLLDKSNEEVEAVCTDCGNIIKIKYVNYNRTVNSVGKYVCPDCVGKYASLHYKKTMKQRYGVEHCSQLESVKKKVAETCLQNYGADNPGKVKELREKQRQTVFEKYGVYYVSQSEEVKNKIRTTTYSHYGVENPSQSVEIRQKIIESNLSSYGVSNVSQAPEIREKVRKTMYKNGTCPTSRQQQYIYNLYLQSNPTAKLNYPISHYSADICFPEEKIVIEYDGGFHDGNVKTGRLTQEEFDHKEIIRSQIIKREGYKQIRLISHHDKLPSDEILLQILDISKQYFNDNPERSWIEFDFDSSLMRNALHKEGVFFDYGELRTLPLQEVA